MRRYRNVVCDQPQSQPWAQQQHSLIKRTVPIITFNRLSIRNKGHLNQRRLFITSIHGNKLTTLHWYVHGLRWMACGGGGWMQRSELSWSSYQRITIDEWVNNWRHGKAISTWLVGYVCGLYGLLCMYNRTRNCLLNEFVMAIKSSFGYMNEYEINVEYYLRLNCTAMGCVAYSLLFILLVQKYFVD